MAFLRVRYRPKPIQPELVEAKANVSFSTAKKEKPPDFDPYAEIKKITSEDPVFLATHTQKKRVEVIVESDEANYRRTHHPTIYERVEIQKEWVTQQLQDEKFATKREALVRKTDKAMQKMRNSLNETPTPGEDVEYDEGLDDDLDVLQEEDDKMEEMNEEVKTMKETQKNLKEQFLAIKERKLIIMRNSVIFHKEKTSSEKRTMFLKMFFGFPVNQKNSKNTTFVTDWLIIGRKEVAVNLQALLQLNVTHILNMTNDVKSAFNKHFMYEKIAVRDSEEEDIAKHFTRMIAFIKRCETSKGRIFVHCLAGSSRAPTAVLAYLITEKRIPLVDAYNYITSLRSFVRPNNRFLFQLAMLEVQLGEGCSV
mmetsp:Transcript_26755/g.29162  ORF Transcript_26755/g.29162 Transcript_26755/m.29162 type:complete len:367 (+) Transcript_26755:74-1174(+)